MGKGGEGREGKGMGEEMVKGLEGVSCEGTLRTLVLSNLEKRRLSGNLIALYNFLRT